MPKSYLTNSLNKQTYTDPNLKKKHKYTENPDLQFRTTSNAQSYLTESRDKQTNTNPKSK